MKKGGLLFLVTSALLILLLGCAEIKPPSPGEVLKKPFGPGLLKTGMTKEQVRSLYGEPDVIIPGEPSPDILGTAREEWIYKALYSKLPVGAGYLSTTKHLFFDGENLTSWRDE